jgi:hypothetical protein
MRLRRGGATGRNFFLRIAGMESASSIAKKQFGIRVDFGAGGMQNKIRSESGMSRPKWIQKKGVPPIFPHDRTNKDFEI